MRIIKKKYFNIKAYCPMEGYFALVFSDITEKRKSEIELELHNRRLEILVNLSALKINSIQILLEEACSNIMDFLHVKNGFLLLTNSEIYDDLLVICINGETKMVADQIIPVIKNESEKWPIGFSTQILNKGVVQELKISDSKAPSKKQSIVYNYKSKDNTNFIFWSVSPEKHAIELYQKHLDIIAYNLWQLIEKQSYVDHIIQEKGKAELIESRFDEIQKAGKIGWYEALIDEGLFLGSYETYNIFFD